jgi:uncharacterized membrane protein YhaH (DUF805 family)
MVLLVFIPWLMWGFAITTERLHDRDKSPWWLVLFYGVPAVLGQLAKAAWFPESAGTALHYVLTLAAFVLTGDLLKSTACAAAPGRTNMAPTR